MKPESSTLAPRSLPGGVVILVGLAAAVVTLAGIRGVAGILAPTFLAAVLAIAADPLRSGLVKRNVPPWLATVVTIVVVYVGLLALCLSMLVAGARFATLIPTYQDQLTSLLAGVEDWLSSLGVTSSQSSAILAQFDLSRLAGVVTSILSTVLGLTTNLLFVVALILFMCVDAGSFGRHLVTVREHHPAFVVALESFAHGTRKYLLVSTAFGLVVAVIDTGLLWLLGVPGAALWGLLAFVTNYVPNIGFVLGLIPPAVIALLEGGPGLMLAVVAAYCVVNVVIQSVIQPKLVGDAVGISASVTFLSLVAWAWVLGPLGAVLAVPATLLVKAMFVDTNPSLQWFSGLIGIPLERPTEPIADAEVPTDAEPENVREPDAVEEGEDGSDTV